MKISFVIPCRSNAKYFKWAYDSIRKHQGDHEVFICAADDASTDNTKDVFQALSEIDSHFDYITNPGPDRVGHTILYDRIVKELVKTDIAIIWHADMYLCPGALDEIENLMYDQVDASKNPYEPYIPLIITNPDGSWNYPPKYKTIVSLTRIEPPLHPDGPEKYLADWGTEPEDFNETAFLQWFISPEADGYKPKYDPPYTTGIFAPWAFFVKDFLEIGGHDPLYRPQSKEDSDIFNRFKLNGCKFIQTWKGCTYHMTCRGSRFNPSLTTPGINSKEWESHNIKSHRNFIRKWGSSVNHDQHLNPIVPNKYYTKFNIKNSTYNLIQVLEPHCDLLETDLDKNLLQEYFTQEQKNTDFDLELKLFRSGSITPSVTVYIDGNKFNSNDYHMLNNLSQIIDYSNQQLSFGASGEFNLGSMVVKILNLTPMTHTLIHLNNPQYTHRLKSTIV